MSAFRPISLYLHIPFCSKRCGYCHFNTFEGLERLFVPFGEALCSESAYYAGEISESWEIQTVFFGGGTPTYLPLGVFRQILSALHRDWRWADGVEVSAEANPTHITPSYLDGLLEAGINRLSFGAQAFDEALLRMLDREHGVAQISEALQMARHAGFANVNLDLMYGLPLQTLEQWRASLEAADNLRPEHLSLYGLTIDEGTAFKHRVERGLLPQPNADLAADMYVMAEEYLADAGYVQYEISNWALPCRLCQGVSGDDFAVDALMTCRHNLTYWHNLPYLGFGPGAHSYFGGRRFWNVNPVQSYNELRERAESVVAGSEEIGPSLERAETAILGLRLNEGIARAKFRERFGETLDDVFGPTLLECGGWGLLEDDGERVRLTRRGRLLSNEVFQRLLPD